MSTATPMNALGRAIRYVGQNQGLRLTLRQVRQINRMAKRETVREAAQTPSAGPPPS